MILNNFNHKNSPKTLVADILEIKLSHWYFLSKIYTFNNSKPYCLEQILCFILIIALSLFGFQVIKSQLLLFLHSFISYIYLSIYRSIYLSIYMKYITLPKLTILAILFKITSIRLYKNPTDCFLLLPTQDNFSTN